MNIQQGISTNRSIHATFRLYVAAAVFFAGCLYLLLQEQTNPLISVLMACLFLSLANINRRLAIYLMTVFLFLLGDVRRIVGTIFGFPTLDTLLLVGPLFTIALSATALTSPDLRSRESKCVLALMTIMVLQVINPQQGGLTVGITGLMFYLIPILWFWIGLKYASMEVTKNVLYRIVVPIGLFAAVLGLYQTYVGFLPWEQAWIERVGANYSALYLGGGIVRAFGFSVNSVEYTDLLLISGSVVVGVVLTGKRLWVVFLPVIFFALFLASSRTSILKLMVGISAAWAVKNSGRGWSIRLPAALAVIVVIGLLLLKSTSSDMSRKTSAAEISIQHQVSGLKDPTNSKYSTAGLHSQMFLLGIWEGIKSPLGHGVGAPTLAGGKFTDSTLGSTEVDISDAFVALGLIGGSIYTFLIFTVIRTALRASKSIEYYQVSLPVIAILTSMLGAWIALGQYAVSPLIWFLIGGLTRSQSEFRNTERTLPGGTFRLSVEILTKRRQDFRRAT